MATTHVRRRRPPRIRGAAVLKLQDRLGLRVEQLAAALGVHRSSVYRWEDQRWAGSRTRVTETLTRLAALDDAMLRDLGMRVLAALDRGDEIGAHCAILVAITA